MIPLNVVQDIVVGLGVVLIILLLVYLVLARKEEE